MNQIQTVLFDLGNVIVYIDFGAFWRELGFLRPEEIISFKDRYNELTLKYETGYISTDGYLGGLEKIFENKFTFGQLERAFSCIIQEPVEGMADIVKRVSIKCRTALVSNTNEIHYKYSLIKLEGMKIFQKHYLSYKLRIMKPAFGFYDAIIKDQGILPSRMLFIDDIVENVETAKSAGLQTILFRNTKELEKELKRLDVL